MCSNSHIVTELSFALKFLFSKVGRICLKTIDDSFFIVITDVLEIGLFKFLLGLEFILPWIIDFFSQSTKEVFCRAVIKCVPFPYHGLDDFVVLKVFFIDFNLVLITLIRMKGRVVKPMSMMMDQLIEHPANLFHIGCRELVISKHFSGMVVDDGREIEHSKSSSELSNICP